MSGRHTQTDSSGSTVQSPRRIAAAVGAALGNEHGGHEMQERRFDWRPTPDEVARIVDELRPIIVELARRSTPQGGWSAGTAVGRVPVASGAGRPFPAMVG